MRALPLLLLCGCGTTLRAGLGVTGGQGGVGLELRVEAVAYRRLDTGNELAKRVAVGGVAVGGVSKEGPFGAMGGDVELLFAYPRGGGVGSDFRFAAQVVGAVEQGAGVLFGPTLGFGLGVGDSLRTTVGGYFSCLIGPASNNPDDVAGYCALGIMVERFSAPR